MSRIEPTDRGLAGALFTPLSWLYGARCARGWRCMARDCSRAGKVGCASSTSATSRSAAPAKRQWPSCCRCWKKRPSSAAAMAAPARAGAGERRQGNATPYPHAADEALVCAAALPHVPVICAPRRVEGIRAARSRFGAKTVILDDAFSHRAAARDKNILLVDALDRFGGEKLLWPDGCASHFPRRGARTPCLRQHGGRDAVARIRLRLAAAAGYAVFECAIAAESVITHSAKRLRRRQSSAARWRRW